MKAVYLNQRSQTRCLQAVCGPREGLMRPANIRKNEDFKRKIESIGLFLKKIYSIVPIFFLIFIMRPARPCFQAHAARETLWVWDPGFQCLYRYLTEHDSVNDRSIGRFMDWYINSEQRTVFGMKVPTGFQLVLISTNYSSCDCTIKLHHFTDKN